DDERCIGVLIDDRPARRLLGIRTPPDFTFDDLDALHRSIEAASVIDRSTMPLDPDDESSGSIDEPGSPE
ncbi:MAG: hypothetical protein GY921_13375, partial [Phycisphaeraceae bacterium]|nr:hypothetical protein [Phycisphaeraceae bacterium]